LNEEKRTGGAGREDSRFAGIEALPSFQVDRMLKKLMREGGWTEKVLGGRGKHASARRVGGV
jgi:hypothetical protein